MMLKFLLVIGWLGMLVSGPAYFISLHSLRSSLIESSDLLGSRLKSGLMTSWAHVTYKALQDIKHDELYGVKLSAEVIEQARKTRRLLYISFGFFLITLAAGLPLSFLGG